tara:strand:- start:2913 stop:4493 length:1581 start_codon:yes stop_codon:yes gene_type:complete
MHINLKSYIRNKQLIKNIKNFNKKTFQVNRSLSENIILCEFTTNKSIQASFSIFTNFIQKKDNSKIVAYNSNIEENLISKMKRIVKRNIYDNYNYDLYKSFNVSDFIFMEDNKEIKKRSDVKCKELLSKIKKKSDLLNLKIEKIWIGDLIYDSYLQKYSVPTINISSKDFRSFFNRCIYAFYFWLDYFNNNVVKVVIGSHSVYYSAIPMRIGIKNGSKVFQVNLHNVYRLSKNKLFAYEFFSDYKKIFNKFSINYKKKALKYSENQCNKRFGGKVGVNMHYSTKSSFTKYDKTKKVLKNNNKKKILIAAHCFLDAPHVYGKENIFNDFHEWFDYLSNFSKKTNYEWYVKTHPDFKPETQNIIKNFLLKYNHIKLIPPSTSHHQLINEGIDCVLTVYGTISWEYAFFKIPVIASSQNNPHRSFNFSYHAKDKKDLDWAIKNFDKLNLDFSKKNIFKFYFMHNIYRQNNWIVDDIDIFLKKIGGYKNIRSLDFYKEWIKSINRKKILKIEKNLDKFFQSKNFLMPSKI